MPAERRFSYFENMKSIPQERCQFLDLTQKCFNFLWFLPLSRTRDEPKTVLDFLLPKMKKRVLPSKSTVCLRNSSAEPAAIILKNLAKLATG